MSDIAIRQISKPFTAKISPPGSKSLSNRALVLAALTHGACELSNVLFADDTAVMFDGLRKLGFALDIDEPARTVRVEGRGGVIPAKSADLFCGNSGTTIRFLTALCSVGTGEYTLDGVDRMRQRPIGELVDILKNLGVRTSYLQADGYPPVRVMAHGIPGGLIQHGDAKSSQFLSAMLMSAPFAQNEVHVELVGTQTSWPYVAMTMRLMDHFGVTPELIRDPKTGQPKEIIIPQGSYHSTNYVVEPDASNASYFLAAAAIHPGAKVTIEGLGKSSLQGDVGFADVLHRMGADLVFGRDFLTIAGTKRFEGIDINLADMPDTAQTLAAIAVFADGETTVRGLHTLKVKETDRLAALSNELTKLGAKVSTTDDSITIDPPENVRAADIETYDDHRMAMSFALVGTKANGITIKDAACVNKTYPGFFQDLTRVVGE